MKSCHYSGPRVLRDVQYRTDANLAARQSIYAYQRLSINLPATVLDLAGVIRNLRGGLPGNIRIRTHCGCLSAT